MQEIVLATVAGVLIGLSIGLVSFRLASRRQLKEAQETGMHQLYHEIVTKRKHREYQYSDEARRVMETVHLSSILH